MHCLFPLFTCTLLLRVTLNINQSIKINALFVHLNSVYATIRWSFLRLNSNSQM